MSNQSRLPKEPDLTYGPGKGDIKTGDLVRFLRGFSSALQSSRTGNPSMSYALSELSKALQPYSERELQEVLSILEHSSKAISMELPTVSNQLERVDLSSLSLEDVGNFLDANELTKKTLIDLGHARFGISKSRLERQRKQDVLEAVRVAMRNEEALNILGNEAYRQGRRRAT